MKKSPSLRSTTSEIVYWIDLRIQKMLSAPAMWGSEEAVELQVLSLLELRAFAIETRTDTRAVLDLYVAEVQKMYPARFHRPLHEIVHGPDFVKALGHVVTCLSRPQASEI